MWRNNCSIDRAKKKFAMYLLRRYRKYRSRTCLPIGDFDTKICQFYYHKLHRLSVWKYNVIKPIQKYLIFLHLWRSYHIWRYSDSQDKCKDKFHSTPNNRHSQILRYCTCGGAHIVASDWPLAEPTLHTHGEHHVRQDRDWRLKHNYTK
jgi:hypothetical protein